MLDTNVISEAFTASPSSAVLDWLAAQHSESVFITAITQAELLYGIEVLPEGKRRTRLYQAINNVLSEEFQERILPFDEDSARAFARIVSSREAMGLPISQFDAMIASICRSRRAAIATRNVNDFKHCGIDIVNPWEK